MVACILDFQELGNGLTAGSFDASRESHGRSAWTQIVNFRAGNQSTCVRQAFWWKAMPTRRFLERMIIFWILTLMSSCGRMSACLSPDAEMRRAHASDLKAFAAAHASNKGSRSRQGTSDPSKKKHDPAHHPHFKKQRWPTSTELRVRGAPRLPRKKKSQLDALIASHSENMQVPLRSLKEIDSRWAFAFWDSTRICCRSTNCWTLNLVPADSRLNHVLGDSAVAEFLNYISNLHSSSRHLACCCTYAV